MSQQSLVSEAWFPSTTLGLTLFAAVTNECNLRCTHCFANSGPARKDELTTQQWKSVIDQLRKVEGKRILFLTGGEPLCRGDIYELIRYSVREAAIPAVLGTNGTMIDNRVAHLLRDAGILECRVSLDGSNDEINGIVRGAGSFESALEGIRNLKQVGITLTVRTTIMKSNQSDFINIGELLQQEGVSTWEVKHLIPSGRARLASNLSLDFDSRATIIKELITERNMERFKKLRIRFMEGTLNFLYDENASLEDVTRCPAGKRMLLVRPNGNVIPCGYLSKLLVGNIRYDTIDSLWSNSPILAQLRNRSVPAGCKNCDKFYICEGGCLAHNFCPKRLNK